MLPFTVTRPVTIQEVSIAVESRDANRVFVKGVSKRRLHLSIYVPVIADSRGQRPDCPLESPWKRLGVHYDANVSGDLWSVIGEC